MKVLFAFLLISGLNGVVTQENHCQSIPLPPEISFDETSSPGSILFIGDQTNSTTQKWNLSDTNPQVSLEFKNQTYSVLLQQSRDLDVNPCSLAEYQFIQRVSCTGPDGSPKDGDLTFKVNPVNEYSPSAVNREPVHINEGDHLSQIFIRRMFDSFEDRDCPKENPVISISKAAGENDARDYFTVNNATGFLYQTKNFDYEETKFQCGLGQTGGILNITAKDGPHTVTTILTVNFVDVDDTPPVFVRYGCSITCYSCAVPDLSVTINYFDQGIVKTEPSSIKAVDPDSQTNITYSLDVYPEKYKDNIEFENGSFILNQSFANFSNFGESSDFSVVVVLQAMGDNGQKSDNFTLTVNVTVPPPTTPEQTTEPQTTQPTTTEEVTSQPTSSPTTISPSTPTTRTPSTARPTTTPAPTTPAPIEKANPDKSTDNKVLIIVLPIVAALILIILIVVIIKMRKSQPQQKYNLGEKNVNGDTGHDETSTEMDNHAFKDEKEGV
ncbi:uncharacterized protein LOC134271189 [Saccostrea cucullata]|uniref:uncharacterized protein LOC134271189 n=1 Tax=Saccostrea cuccullata TaxID=36930 RepID=UPI002ED36ED7